MPPLPRPPIPPQLPSPFLLPWLSRIWTDATKRLRRDNNLDGGADGVAISAGNSGGASGDALTIPGTAPIYSAAQAHSGTLGLAVVDATAETSVSWPSLALTQTTWFRLYLYLTAFPATNRAYVMRLYTSSGGACAFLRIFTTGIVSMADSGVGGFGAEGSTPVALNQWVRIEWMVSPHTTRGVMQWRLFNSAESEVPTEDLGQFSNLALGADIGDARFGLTTSPYPDVPFTLRLDDLAVSTDGWVGPAAVPVTQSADASQVVTATQESTATVTDLADATQTITATQTAAAASTKPVTASQTVTATQAAAGTSDKPVTASQTITAGQTATASVEKPVSAAQTVTATQAGAATVTDEATASQTITATQTATATVVDLATASQTVTATQSATAASNKPTAATQTVTATQSAAATVEDVAQAAQTVTATQTGTGTSTKPVTASQTVTATQSATATVGTAAIDALASQTVTVTQTATGVVVDQATASQAVTATQTAAAQVVVGIQASQAVTATQSCDALMDRVISAAQVVTADQVAALTQIGTGPRPRPTDLALRTVIVSVVDEADAIRVTRSGLVLT